MDAVRAVWASCGGRGKRTPAVAFVGDPPPGGPGVAADPDRRMRIAHRSRMRGDPAGAEVLALEVHVIGGPDRPDHVERFVEQVGALLEVHAEGGELALEIADADGKGESATGQQIQRRTRLGYYERISIRQHHDIGYQPQRAGAGRGVAHRHERVQRVVSAGLQPPLAGRGMVGEPEPVNAGRLGSNGDRRDAVAADQLRVVRVAVHRMGDREMHLPLSLPGRRRYPREITA
jgi:hypothetical protein